jgi:histidine triad (HIT) family protein
VYADDEVFAFEDINPQAPLHVLVIPRRHVRTLNDLVDADDALIGRMHRAAAHVARDRGVAQSGYRIVSNCNGHAGQSVWHIHLHVLGGRPLHWPPG